MNLSFRPGLATYESKPMTAILKCICPGLLIVLISTINLAQDIQAQKSCVVRIVNTKLEQQGTGFVVKANADEIYIVTASHVVSGAQFHDVYFLNRTTPIQGKVFDREEDALKGLALIVVKRDASTPTSVTVMDLGQSINLKGGESIQTIGFPGGTKISTVGTGSIKRLEGRSLVLSGEATKGDSGGPVLLNGVAIGLITDVMEPDRIFYAVQAESIALYLGGCGINSDDKDLPPNEDAVKHTALGGEHWQRANSAGNSEIFNSEMSAALADYRIAESQQPKNALFRINTGATLNRLGKYEEAIVKLREGVRLDPKVAWFHNELCVALKMLKRFDEADPECLAAVKFDQNNAAFQETLLRALEQLDRERASRH